MSCLNKTVIKVKIIREYRRQEPTVDKKFTLHNHIDRLKCNERRRHKC